jgi:hypothetical protein
MNHDLEGTRFVRFLTAGWLPTKRVPFQMLLLSR